MDDTDRTNELLMEEILNLKKKVEELQRDAAMWEELEGALKTSEEQYRVLVEKSQLGIFIDDKDGDFIYCNERVPEMFGLSMEEFIAQHPSERILPEDWEKMSKYHEHRIQGGEPPSNYEIKARKKDGSIIDIEVNVVTLEEAGTIRGTMSYIKDITNRKKEEEELRNARDELEKQVQLRTKELKTANETLGRDLEKIKRVEKALRDSEDYYKRIIETLHDALIIFDPDGEIIIDANQRTCDMYGYTKQELIGRSLIPMTKDVDAGKGKIQTTLKEGYYPNFETIHFRKDGTEIVLEVNASVVDHRGQKVIVTIFRDKTKEKRILDALKESEEKYRNIIERASDGILIIQDEFVKFANPRLAEIAGTTVEEMVGKPFTDFVHPDQRETLKKNYQRRVKGEVFDPIYRTKLLKADGTTINAEINAGVITFNEKPANLVFVRDLSCKDS